MSPSPITTTLAGQLIHHAAQEGLAEALLNAATQRNPGISAAVWQAHETQIQRLHDRPPVTLTLDVAVDPQQPLLRLLDDDANHLLSLLRALGPKATVRISF